VRRQDLVPLSALIAVAAWCFSAPKPKTPAVPTPASPTAQNRTSWERSSVRVNGIALGDTLDQARRKLGPPAGSRTQKAEQYCWWTSARQSTEVWFRHGRAARIMGPDLTINGRSATVEQLGPPDDAHDYGYFGSPMHCWQRPALIVELFSDQTGAAALNCAFLVDPTLPEPHFTEARRPSRRKR
jgi:hypothetical protein